jgi:hypothetical protein
MKRFRDKAPGRQLIEKAIDELLIKEARLGKRQSNCRPVRSVKIF